MASSACRACGSADTKPEAARASRGLEARARYRGAAYWSEDGGESWHEGASATERLFYAVSMADRRRGWAVGQRGTVLRTEDGGRPVWIFEAVRFLPDRDITVTWK